MTERVGYCAPLRCYCGDETCPAFESYIPRDQLPDHQPDAAPKRRKQAESWANREGETWIDRT
jgi:hypothetical protein